MMEEVEASILDGDVVIASGVPVLIDALLLPGGSTDPQAWHAHAHLSLGVVVPPAQELELRVTDGRSAPVMLQGPPTIEGGEALYVFTGLGPLAKP
jgi:hypothetical protein